MKNNQVKNGERFLTGIPASPGIGIGPARLLVQKEVEVSRRRVPREQVDRELEDFHRARAELIAELEASKRGLPQKLAQLVEAQIMILQDPRFVEHVERVVRTDRYSAEYAVLQVANSLARSLEEGNHHYFQERSLEIQQMARELVYKMQPLGHEAVEEVQPGEVVFAMDLSVKDTLFLVKRDIAGVVLQAGGATSHTAILLRDFGIPGVFGVSSFEGVQNGTITIVDGNRGLAVISPRQSTLDRYRERQMQLQAFHRGLKKLVGQAAVTRDGRELSLKMNLDFPEEMEIIDRFERRGVGLFRTEVLFFSGHTDEASQARIYRTLSEKVYPHTATIRIFDIGGDKILGQPERNPFLGLRGIRALLKERRTLERQLRAILRANEKGNLKVMLPMVTTVEEVQTFLEIFQQVIQEFGGEVQVPSVGVMVEVPSMALTVDLLEGLVDFISIGTNDLTQYVLAVDRRNPRVSYLYDSFHPAVVRLLEWVVHRARKRNLLVSVCGEMASDPLGIPLLVALGVDELSVAPAALLQSKEIIRHLSMEELQSLKRKVLQARTSAEVRQLIYEYLRESAADLLPYLPALPVDTPEPRV